MGVKFTEKKRYVTLDWTNLETTPPVPGLADSVRPLALTVGVVLV